MTLSGPREVVYGEKVLYKLTFSNPGDADTTNVDVRLLPLGTGDTPLDSHNIGTLKAGETKVLEMELVARQSGTLSIKAEATADSGLRATVNEEVLVRRAALKIDIEAPKFQYARSAVTYTVRVSNPGNDIARNLEIAAQLPSRAAYVSSTGGTVNTAGTQVTWDVRSLGPGEEQAFQLRCQLESTGLNRLQVAAKSGDLHETALAATDVEGLADLTLDVNRPVGAFHVGEEVTYEVVIKNRGTKTAENVEVLAFFSQGIEAVSAAGARHEIAPGQVTFQALPSIAPDKELVLKIKARADTSGNHTFRAEVYCKALGTKLGQEATIRFYDGRPNAAAAPVNSAAPNNASQSKGRYDDTNAPLPGRYSADTFAPAESKPAGDRYQ
jgi:uncharacterized repeat protein (TIGR01451 family)